MIKKCNKIKCQYTECDLICGKPLLIGTTTCKCGRQLKVIVDSAQIDTVMRCKTCKTPYVVEVKLFIEKFPDTEWFDVVFNEATDAMIRELIEDMWVMFDGEI